MKRVSSSSRVAVTFACTSLVAMVSQMQAAVVTSGLLVDLDAANFTPGGGDADEGDGGWGEWGVF
jgi:hypothetical protein